MKYLVERYWDGIMQTGKGERFENLVEDLLKEMFPSIIWDRTKKTHDGKKDFIAMLPVQGIGDLYTYWIECKNYKDRVSINTFSPTLVMAIIKNTNGVIFFSYSKVNDNAIDYLSQFGAKTEKRISIYDDDKLENEILKYDKILNKYFPDYDGAKQTGSIIDADMLCRVNFSRDSGYSYANGAALKYEHTGNKVLQVNETFCIDVFIRNLSSVNKNVELRLNPKEYGTHFALLDNSMIRKNHIERIAINPVGVYFKRFVFRLEGYAVKMPLPCIYIYEDGIKVNELQAGYVTGNWIINAPLIGGNYLGIVENVKNVTAYRNNAITYCMHGESGTGKTRLLKEVKDVLIANGYRIFSEDGDFQNEKSTGIRLLRRVISDLSGLPLNKFNLSYDDDISSDSYEHEWKNDRIARLLYSNSFSLEQSLMEATDIFISLSSVSPTALIIDNVQFYDEDLALFLHNLLDESLGKPISLALVLSFNTDYLLPQTKAFELFERVKRLTKDKPTLFFCSEIRGFEEGQSEQYIEHCIPGISKLYPDTMRYIISKVGHFPLYIEQMLHLLHDNFAIKKNEGLFYVSDIGKLHSSINSLPKRIGELIQLRWDALLSHQSASIYENILKFVTLFQKLPSDLASNLGFTEQSVNTLISLGILERTVSEQIVFHHSQLLIFFNSHYFSTGIDLKTAERSAELIEKLNLQNSYPAQYFIAKNILKPRDEEVLRFGVDCLLNEDINKEFRPNFAMHLYKSLKIIKTNDETIPIIKVYTKICEDIKTYTHFSKALDLFTEVYNDEFENYKKYLPQGDDYFYFIFRYANSFLSIHKDQEAHEILSKALNKIDEFRFTSSDKKKRAQAAILNRLCVTFKSLNEPIRAEEVVDESLKLSHEINDKTTIFKNYIDKGYIYYKDNSKVEQLLDCWDKAWDIFDKEYDPSMEKRSISAYHYKALVEFIRQNRKEALHYSDKALKIAERELDVFNKIKILLVRNMIFYMENPHNIESIEESIGNIIDLCTRHNSIRSYWTSWHLLGKVSNDGGIRHHAYITALELLNGFADDKRVELLYLYFYDDLAMNLRRMKINSAEEIRKVLFFISNEHVRNRVSQILKMSDVDFSIFERTYKPTTPINDGHTNFPCP